MTKNLLDLSEKIDLATIKLYEVVNQVTNDLGISYMVVGATARDLVLHHGYGAPVKRATTDIDFGIQLESWEAFEKLKSTLIENKFQAGKFAHQLTGPEGTKIDIVPFGSLEDKESNIQFPPEGDFEMSVLGFREAHDHADKVIIQQEPLVEIPVVSPQGLALLKIIAWSDRERNKRVNDAEDVKYLLETYESVHGVTDRIYEDAELMEQYDWNISLASAHMLGVDTALISSEGTKQIVKTILLNNLGDGSNNLVVDMGGQYEYKENYSLLRAFSDGYSKKWI